MKYVPKGSAFLAAGLLAVLAAGAEARVLDRHPLFGQDIIGNRAEVVTLGRTASDSIPLAIHDFASDALTPSGSPVNFPLGTPGDFTNGLVAYWSFDTDFTATYGGSAFDGDPHGPMATGDVTIDPTQGRFDGGSAFFTRSLATAVVISTPVITQGQDYTYSAWYRDSNGDVPDNVRQVILETSPSGAYACNVGIIDPGSGEDWFRLYARAASGTAYTTDWRHSADHAAWPYGWNNVVVTYDASAARHSLYWNGRWRKDLSSSSTLMDTDGLLIGNAPGSTSLAWDGWIDDVAFWNRVLTPDEIWALQSHEVVGPYPHFQQMDLARGDFDGDDRDDVVAVYGRETADPFTQDLWMVVPDIQDGVLDWDSPRTTWTLLPWTTHVPNASTSAPGTLRLVAGNFDDDEESEFALMHCIRGSTTTLWYRSCEIDSASRAPTSWTEVVSRDMTEAGVTRHGDSERGDLVAADLDGDRIDELIVSYNYTPSSSNAWHTVEILRKEGLFWVSEVSCNGLSWPSGTWDPGRDFWAGVDQRARSRLACAAGVVRSGASVVPYIVVATDELTWRDLAGANRSLSFNDRWWLLRVDTSASPWTVTHQHYGEEDVLSWLPQLRWNVTGPLLGVTTGDLDFDGSDEVALDGQNLRVFDVSGSPLSLTQVAWLPTWDLRFNDPSHRVIEIVDLDADPERDSPSSWCPEIVFQQWHQGPAHRHTRVVRPSLQMQVAGEDTSWTVNGVVAVCQLEHAPASPGTFASLASDLDGDGFRIGPYTYHQSVASITPQVILKSPPILRDIVPETASPDTVDLTGCWTACDFWAKYAWSVTDSLTVQTEFKPGWGAASGLLAKAPRNVFNKAWNWVSKTFVRDYGANFSNTSISSRVVRVGIERTASISDYILSAKTNWDVYEYEMRGHGDAIGHFVVVVPDAGLPVWHTSRSWMNAFGSAQNDAYRLDHENGSVVSYPTDLPIYGQDLLKQASQQMIVSYGGDFGHFFFNSSDFQSATADTTRNSGLLVGTIVDALGSAIGLSGQYTSDSLMVCTTALQTDVAVDIQLGGINREDWEYFVTPKVYWSGAALVVDYEVSVSAVDGAGPEWANRYGTLPDPGFVLPRRYDFLHDPNWSGDDLYQCPDVAVLAPSIRENKPFARVGETVTIAADVRNLSLVPLTVAPSVEFYVWDPDWPAAMSIGTVTADTMGVRSKAPTVSVDWVVPSWADPEMRLYARIDPPSDGFPNGFITEVHENNNIGYTVLKTDGDGTGPATDTPVVAWMPSVFALRQGAPNPFGPSTTLAYELPRPCLVSLRVYDVQGRLVRVLENDEKLPGRYTALWDGSNGAGERVAAGVYFCRLEAGDFHQTRKLVHVK